MFTRSARVSLYLLLWFLLIPLYLVSSRSSGRAQLANQAAVGGQQEPACPGDQMPTPITGTSDRVPSPEAMVRGEPLTGRWWDPGSRSFWHCHGGGQYMVLMEGTGRVQKRGERMRDLHLGDIEFAGPGVEHWHGASASEGARLIHQGLAIDGGSGTFWLEEVTQSDYLGNDIGIASRTRFLETGER